MRGRLLTNCERRGFVLTDNVETESIASNAFGRPRPHAGLSFRQMMAITSGQKSAGLYICPSVCV